MSHDIYIPTREKKILSWDGPGPEMGVEGWYRFVLKNRDGSVARDTGWFKNVITNVGMKQIVEYNSPKGAQLAQYLFIGDGVGTPAFTDISLFGTQLGDHKFLNHTGSGFVGSSYYYSRYYARWPVGEGTGTISEVAAALQYFGFHYHSHALLVDSGGSPTTIVKGADQSLDVYYELRNYPNMTDAIGTIDISGVSYDYALRPWGFFTPFGGAWQANGQLRINTGSAEHSAYTGKTALIGIFDSASVGGGTWLGQADLGVTYSYYSGPLPDFNTGPYYNDNYVEAGIDTWNSTIDWVMVKCGCTSWQFTLAKTVGGGGLVKTDEERLRLHIRLTAARH